MIEIEVTRCEECPLWSADAAGDEYCSKGGRPLDRYKVWDIEESAGEEKDIPDNCPLIKEPVMIKLKV